MMAGEARTSAFVLASATVMIGEQTQLYDLTPTANSLGLVKNFKSEATPTYVNLTQGPKGQTVYSVMTSHPVKATCEVYEFTTENMAYGLALDGASLTPTYADAFLTTTTLTGSTSAPVTTATVAMPTDMSSVYTTGSWIMIQDVVNTDHAHYAQLTANGTYSAGGSTMTVQFANQGLKSGNNFAVGSRLTLVNCLAVGSTANQPFLSCKVVSPLPERNEPLTLLLPKVRITKGFSMAFTTDTFANLPFEFEPYTLLPTDPFYDIFGGNSLGQLMSAN